MVIRDAALSDAAALEPVIRLADPDNPDGSWRQLPTAIRQSLEAGPNPSCRHRQALVRHLAEQNTVPAGCSTPGVHRVPHDGHWAASRASRNAATLARTRRA
ncbi:hypothetical protein [Streptomyces syringium]|uniref:hypothetical protein n=1 Tax=Streptomyces syringium TaxID=76729 RepID=UPI00343DD977